MVLSIEIGPGRLGIGKDPELFLTFSDGHLELLSWGDGVGGRPLFLHATMHHPAPCSQHAQLLVLAWASLIAQLVKNPPALWETLV